MNSCPAGAKATDLRVLMASHSDKAEHPVDASLDMTGRNMAWSANPVCSLRPLGSDLNTVKRGRTF